MTALPIAKCASIDTRVLIIAPSSSKACDAGNSMGGIRAAGSTGELAGFR
jgi:hypothetical protein